MCNFYCVNQEFDRALAQACKGDISVYVGGIIK